MQTSEYSSQPVRINPTGGNPQHQQHQEYSRGNQGQPNAPVQNSFPQQYNYPQQPNNFPQQQGYYPQQQPSENVYPQQQPQNISNPIVANPKQIAVQSKPPSSQT